jgi:hypothetical protein
MVRFERSVRTKPGKMGEALAWANEVAKYINDRSPDGNDVLVFNQLFGDVGAVGWFVDTANLNDLNVMMSDLAADEKYWAVVNKGADLLVEATAQDRLWQQVPA